MVARFDPFHLTTELATKLVPYTIKVKSAPPALFEVGLRLVVVGTGLLTIKALLLLAVPPAVVT